MFFQRRSTPCSTCIHLTSVPRLYLLHYDVSRRPQPAGKRSPWEGGQVSITPRLCLELGLALSRRGQNQDLTTARSFTVMRRETRIV